MKPRPIPQPGICTPEFMLPVINGEEKVNVGGESKWVLILLFFGAYVTDEIATQLEEYQERVLDIESHNARIVGITDAASDDARKLAEDKKIEFPIVSVRPSSKIVHWYGVGDGDTILPAVFIVDQAGLIRRVFQPDAARGLPGPAVMIRAINNIAKSPKASLLATDDWRLGPAEAQVSLIEYGDYQCMHCRDLFHVVQQLLPAYQDNVQFIFRHFPMRHVHPLAINAARAAEAAGEQGRFWEMHARLFEADSAPERENVLEYAREIGLDMKKFCADLDSVRSEQAVMEDYHEAVKHKVKSPPTLFVNYILFDGIPTLENLQNRIDNLLSCLT